MIFAEDVEKIFGKRPWKSRTQEIMNDNEDQEETKALEAGTAAEGAAEGAAAVATGAEGSAKAAEGSAKAAEGSAKAGEAPTLPEVGNEKKDNDQNV